MNLTYSAAILVSGLLALTPSAHAEDALAVLLSATGKVLVNAGKGFRPAVPTVQIESGYQILVSDGAGATLHFNDADCNVALAASSVTRITDASMCQSAELQNPGLQPQLGSENAVVITPANAIGVLPAPAVSGIISPYAIAGGIFTISAAAFTDSVLTPVSAP